MAAINLICVLISCSIVRCSFPSLRYNALEDFTIGKEHTIVIDVHEYASDIAAVVDEVRTELESRPGDYVSRLEFYAAEGTKQFCFFLKTFHLCRSIFDYRSRRIIARPCTIGVFQ